MKLAVANEVLPQFKHLEGMYSVYYQARIERVFVSFRSISVTVMFKNSHRLGLKNFHPPHDESNDFTIVVAFENEKVISVRNLVIAEKMRALYEEVRVLDYMHR